MVCAEALCDGDPLGTVSTAMIVVAPMSGASL
jgi:hypothetical protein